jgi:hypothetical protein
MSHLAGVSRSQHGRPGFRPPREDRTPRLEVQPGVDRVRFRELDDVVASPDSTALDRAPSRGEATAADHDNSVNLTHGTREGPV